MPQASNENAPLALNTYAGGVKFALHLVLPHASHSEAATGLSRATFAVAFPKIQMLSSLRVAASSLHLPPCQRGRR
jgi:hypothetical protein